jgi:uncharacterized protein (TIGR00369 family)
VAEAGAQTQQDGRIDVDPDACAMSPKLHELPAVRSGVRADLAAAIEAMPASRLLGLKVEGFDAAGISRLVLPIVPALTFDGRVVQGGLVGVLADYAGVSAAACTLPAGWIASTTGFEVHNVAPAVGERLVAIGRALHVGRGSAVSRAEVYAVSGDEAVLVCIATTTCRPFELKAA